VLNALRVANLAGAAQPSNKQCYDNQTSPPALGAALEMAGFAICCPRLNACAPRAAPPQKKIYCSNRIINHEK
jgi:hypothetical protein